MSELVRWMLSNGRSVLEAAGIIGGLMFTAASFRADAKERRISNLMSIAESHRTLWLQVTQSPELYRVLKDDVDFEAAPITPSEERFVHLLIIHLFVTYESERHNSLPKLSGLQKDIRDFFSHPIPKQVWRWSRQFQELPFRQFVDDATPET